MRRVSLDGHYILCTTSLLSNTVRLLALMNRRCEAYQVRVDTPLFDRNEQVLHKIRMIYKKARAEKQILVGF